METWGVRLFWGGFLLLIPSMFFHSALQEDYPALKEYWIVAPSILCIVIGGWMYFVATMRKFFTGKW